jgi:lipoprotein NlpD
VACCAVALAVLAACAVRQPSPAERKAASAKPATPPAAAAARPVIQPSTDGAYVVKKGDTLYSIALEHGADYREVAQWNGLTDPTKIEIGQRLKVRAPEGSATVAPVKGGGAPEARPLEKPQPPAVAKGSPPEAARAPEAANVAESIQFMWPAKGKVIAGFAAPRSKGIDIDGKLGAPVVAAAAGRVTYVGSGIPGLGKLVVIKHDAGFITVYAHNREILVKEQQSVAQGQKIAEIGATDADRPKLHFQIRRGSAPVDPLRYLPSS